MSTKNLSKVEIFASGAWMPGNLAGKSLAFSDGDIDDIVAAFAERSSAGRVPLKLGHNDAQAVADGQPALGWVSRVWREGEKLLADFTDLPMVVYNAISSGLYKFVSVELSRDVQTSGGLRRWALDAVALLGADIPAVGNLKDLQALTMSAKGGLRPAAMFTLTQASKSGDQKTMDEKEIAELRAKFSALEVENARLKAAAEATEKAAQDERVKNHREKLIAKFDEAVKAERILPAAQHKFSKSRWFTDDVEVMKITTDEVDTIIKESEAPKKQGGGQARMSANDDARFSALSPDKQVAESVHDYADEHQMDLRDPAQYDRAVKAVFRRNPELAKTYINMPHEVEAR
jgi:hypothetical protein